jgi:5-methylcytosine-specific restriction endonuclease McrA
MSRNYSLADRSDDVLLRDLITLVARDRSITAWLLAHIAEVDRRRLYVPAGHSSMFGYCVDELGLSEDAAYKRIQAARAARAFPALFEAVADGRLHLAAVCLLAPHLTEDNANELVAAATRRRKAEIERFLARRFGGAEAPAITTVLRALPVRPVAVPASALASSPVAVPAASTTTAATDRLAPGQVEPSLDFAAAGSRHAVAQGDTAIAAPSDESGTDGTLDPTSKQVDVDERSFELAPGQVDPSPQPAAAVADRFLLRLEIDRSTHDKLRRAQELLGHAVPSGDIAAILDRALTELVDELERQKFGAKRGRRATKERGQTAEKRAAKRTDRLATTTRRKAIPARIRRAVWERDRGRCTYVNDSGRQCEARRKLEYDHVDPVARGGETSVERMRLRCRAHNQYEAERAFGAEFMNAKRETARRERAERSRASDGAAAPSAEPGS